MGWRFRHHNVCGIGIASPAGFEGEQVISFLSCKVRDAPIPVQDNDSILLDPSTLIWEV